MGFGMYLLLGLLVAGILVIILCNVKLKKDDENKQYDAMGVKELGGKFKTLNKGKLAFVFAYDPVEKRKKQAILDEMATIKQVTDESGVVYNIGEIVSEDYYFKQFTSKDGPYIVYAVFPVTKEPVSEQECIIEIEEVLEEEQAGMADE